MKYDNEIYLRYIIGNQQYTKGTSYRSGMVSGAIEMVIPQTVRHSESHEDELAADENQSMEIINYFGGSD